jgi:hypothetical protein
MYPEVQRKAQAEIDQIVGSSRLPDFSDEVALPYVQAVLKEALRWHPVTPLGGSLSVAAIISLMMKVLLSQPCRTGSLRATPTKDITFLQAQLSYQTRGAFIEIIPLFIRVNGFQGNDARSRSIPRTRQILSRTLAFPRRTCLPEPSIRLRSTAVPWSFLRPREHVVDGCRNTGRIRYYPHRGRPS